LAHGDCDGCSLADEASSYYGMFGCKKKMKKEKEFEKNEKM
jgi:hypothetical protein